MTSQNFEPETPCRHFTSLILYLLDFRTRGPLRAPRITEQPRRQASSARFIHDPMTQGYRPGGGCTSCGTVPRKLLWSPGSFLVVSSQTILGHDHNPPHPPVAHGPRPSKVQVSAMQGRCTCSYLMVNNADPVSPQVGISFVAKVMFGWSEPGLRFLYSNSSRISSSMCFLRS